MALDHETVFYHPTAFVQPLRATYRYGRPWAQNWEEHFEQGWDKPEETSGLAADVLDYFK